MLADFLSQNVVSQFCQSRINSLNLEDQNLEPDQDQGPWIKEIKNWMLTGAECKSTSAISYKKNYWNNQFFIEDDLLWVRIKIRGELARVCLDLPNHKIADILATSHGTLFTGHKGVDKTIRNIFCV
jgi:hypothetical protein